MFVTRLCLSNVPFHFSLCCSINSLQCLASPFRNPFPLRGWQRGMFFHIGRYRPFGTISGKTRDMAVEYCDDNANSSISTVFVKHCILIPDKTSSIFLLVSLEVSVTLLLFFLNGNYIWTTGHAAWRGSSNSAAPRGLLWDGGWDKWQLACLISAELSGSTLLCSPLRRLWEHFYILCLVSLLSQRW